MNKRIALMAVVFVMTVGFAIADDVLIPGKPIGRPWYQEIFVYFERLLEFL